jgi:ATP-dependent helicase/nuclease subunit A
MSSAKLIGENEDVIRIMSIHKSKGLEFPVVFLCGMSKEFNMTDLNKDPILLHQDLGFGPKYINYDEGESYTTLAKEAIKIKSRLELISEEMRIFYVALTRAREKLIMTGISKDYKKEISKKEELLTLYENKENKKVSENIIEKNISYLDWVLLVYLARKKEIEEIFELQVHTKKEVLEKVLKKEEKKEIDLSKNLEYIDKERMKEIKKKLEWEYEGKILNNLLTKTSVTKIKNMKIDLESDEERIEYKTPEFLKEEKALTSTEKGSLMHLILQKLDERVNYDETELDKMLENLKKKGIIDERERKAVDIEKIIMFMKTKIWKELKSAKEVHKEKPFYINLPASEVYEEDINENVLVQGIIDLYYVTEKRRNSFSRL